MHAKVIDTLNMEALANFQLMHIYVYTYMTVIFFRFDRIVRIMSYYNDY